MKNPDRYAHLENPENPDLKGRKPDDIRRNGHRRKLKIEN